MLTITEFANRNGLGEERVRQYCKQGKIAGAQKVGHGLRGIWLIPEDAQLHRNLVGRPLNQMDSNHRIVESMIRAESLDEQQRVLEWAQFMNRSAKNKVLHVERGSRTFSSMLEKNHFDEERLSKHIAAVALEMDGL